MHSFRRSCGPQATLAESYVLQTFAALATVRVVIGRAQLRVVLVTRTALVSLVLPLISSKPFSRDVPLLFTAPSTQLEVLGRYGVVFVAT